MKIGIIAEGITDIAVIQNLLKGIAGVDISDTIPLRPSMKYDETDLAYRNQNPENFGSWTNVKSDCESGEKLEKFLNIVGQDFIIIHLDTSEIDQCDISRPKKNSKEYCELLREEVIKKVNSWLDNKYSDNLLYAITIEESEAWLLALFSKGDTTVSIDPKRKLKRVLNRIDLNSELSYENYISLSDLFSKRKIVKNFNWPGSNKSLNMFCVDVDTKLNKETIY